MNQYVFTVKGMRCGMCESHINDAVRRCAKIKKVKSSHFKDETIVVADELDIDKIKFEIRQLGYDVDDNVIVSEYKKKFLGIF